MGEFDFSQFDPSYYYPDFFQNDPGMFDPSYYYSAFPDMYAPSDMYSYGTEQYGPWNTGSGYGPGDTITLLQTLEQQAQTPQEKSFWDGLLKQATANPLGAAALLGGLATGAGGLLGSSTPKVSVPNSGGSVALSPEAQALQNLLLKNATSQSELSSARDKLLMDTYASGAPAAVINQNLGNAARQAALQDQAISNGQLGLSNMAEVLGQDSSGPAGYTQEYRDYARTHGVSPDHIWTQQDYLKTGKPLYGPAGDISPIYAGENDLRKQANDLLSKELAAPGQASQALQQQYADERRKFEDQQRQALGEGYLTSTPYATSNREFTRGWENTLEDDALNRKNQRIATYNSVAMPRSQFIAGEKNNAYARALQAFGQGTQGAPTSASTVGTLFGGDPSQISIAGLSSLGSLGTQQAAQQLAAQQFNAQTAQNNTNALMNFGGALAGYGLSSFNRPDYTKLYKLFGV